MNSVQPIKRSKDFLVVLLFLQFTSFITIVFDVPVVRQVVGFILLIFFPGFIILKLLRLSIVGKLETFIFSAGFSVALMILAGLLINELGFYFGIPHPLSLIPLMAIINVPIFIGGVSLYLRKDNVKLRISTCSFKKRSLFALLFVCIPLMSIIGAMLVNFNGDNLILLAMITTIAALFSIAAISQRLLHARFYPFALLMITISLLYHYSLISNYIVSLGSDINIEYFVSRVTGDNAHWISPLPSVLIMGYSRVNAMLSVTILPTIYSTLLNIDHAWIFKMIFPLIFSLVPLCLYQILKMQIGKKYALISAFLFVAQETFYTEMLGLNRQMIGELFFGLLLLVIVKKKMRHVDRTICFTIFGFALIVSHYALAEIFLFLISFAFVFLIVLKRPSRNITSRMIMLFFVLMFAWYIYTSGSAVFDSFISYANHVYNQLGDFFNPASRGELVLRGLGLEAAPSIWNAISRYFAYATQALIIIGFIGLLLSRKKSRFDIHYSIFCSAAVALLFALILVPGLAETLKMTRFYHILLFFLAPLFVLGGEALVKLVSKQAKESAVSILLLIVLIPYFFFQTGFVYEVTQGESWSLPLSMYRMETHKLQRLLGYVVAQDAVSAIWISKKSALQYVSVYADVSSQANILVSQSLLYTGSVNPLTNITKIPATGIVYLSSLNVVGGIVAGTGHTWNTSELSPILDGLNKIYSNGASEIYKSGYPEIEKEAP